MKKKSITTLLSIVLLVLFISSCTSVQKTMKEPNILLRLEKSDFTLSEQKMAQASSTTILGVDFERLFTQKSGSIESSSQSIRLASIPVLGKMLTDKTSGYALYELMQQNPGYDVAIYPQYETTVNAPILGIGFLTKKTTVKVTSRLGKLAN